MSLYTWGSTGHGALGFICSHVRASIADPRQIDFPKHILFTKVQTGNANTWGLTSNGEIIVFGASFGPIPQRVSDLRILEDFSCSLYAPVAICIRQGCSEVSWISPEGTFPILHGGRLLRGSAVACRDATYGLVVQLDSSEVLEVGSSAPLLRPSHLKLISPASQVYQSMLFSAAVSAQTSEVRIWDNECLLLSKPARVVLRPNVHSSPSSEWLDISEEHFLRNVTQLSLPNNKNGYGYAVESARSHILVRFPLFSPASSQPISTIYADMCIQTQDRLAIVSISQNDTYLFVVDSSGSLFRIPHSIAQTGILTNFKILDQVREVSVSHNHCAVVISIRQFLANSDHGSTSQPSLQRACSLSIMKNKVAVENVTRVILSLLSRAVMDLGILLDFCHSFFSSNRNLIKYIATEDYEELIGCDEYGLSEERMRKDHVSFSEALIRVRGERADSAHVTVRSPPITRSRKKERRMTNRVENSEIDQTVEPHICMRIVDSQATTEDEEICIDESFVPLDEAVCESGRKRSDNFRVRKWSKCSNQKVFGDPSLVSPVTAPWSPPRSVSPMVTSLVSEFALPESRKSRSSTPSRWFRGDPNATTPTVADAILEALEERDTAEAIRLVEEFEKREKEKRRDKNQRKRHAQFNSIIARH